MIKKYLLIAALVVIPAGFAFAQTSTNERCVVYNNKYVMFYNHGNVQNSNENWWISSDSSAEMGESILNSLTQATLANCQSGASPTSQGVPAGGFPSPLPSPSLSPANETGILPHPNAIQPIQDTINVPATAAPSPSPTANGMIKLSVLAKKSGTNRPIGAVKITMTDGTNTQDVTLNDPPDPNGQAIFQAIPGKYTLNISRSGYQSITNKQIELSSSSPELKLSIDLVAESFTASPELDYQARMLAAYYASINNQSNLGFPYNSNPTYSQNPATGQYAPTNGINTTYTYNPQTGQYIPTSSANNITYSYNSSTGQYVPTNSTSTGTTFTYNPSTGQYIPSSNSGSGVPYAYNPSTGQYIPNSNSGSGISFYYNSSTGQFVLNINSENNSPYSYNNTNGQYQPTTNTNSGTTYTLNPATGQYIPVNNANASTTYTYNPATNQYVPTTSAGSNVTYTYNPSTGQYIPTSGTNTGVTFTYNASTNQYVPNNSNPTSSGTYTYNPATNQYVPTGSTGSYNTALAQNGYMLSSNQLSVIPITIKIQMYGLLSANQDSTISLVDVATGNSVTIASANAQTNLGAYSPTSQIYRSGCLKPNNQYILRIYGVQQTIPNQLPGQDFPFTTPSIGSYVDMSIAPPLSINYGGSHYANVITQNLISQNSAQLGFTCPSAYNSTTQTSSWPTPNTGQTNPTTSSGTTIWTDQVINPTNFGNYHLENKSPSGYFVVSNINSFDQRQVTFVQSNNSLGGLAFVPAESTITGSSGYSSQWYVTTYTRNGSTPTLDLSRLTKVNFTPTQYQQAVSGQVLNSF